MARQNRSMHDSGEGRWRRRWLVWLLLILLAVGIFVTGWALRGGDGLQNAANVAQVVSVAFAVPGLIGVAWRLRQQHAHPAALPAPPADRHLIGVLPPRAGAFQDRALMRQLAAADGETGSYVLCGLGGVGKTQLAAEYARRAWAACDVDVLLWVRATTRDAIVDAYRHAAEQTLGSQEGAAPQIAERWWAWLAATPSRWLVVLDDVQDPADVRGLWPPHTGTGQVVVTTRRREAALDADGRHIVEVGLFTPGEAAVFLTQRLASRPSQADGATELAAALGFLPLALAQAAAYIADHPVLTCATYRDQVLDQRTMLANSLPDDSALPDDHRLSVAATWAMSIEHADALKPAGVTRPLLELVAMLDPNGIPQDVLTTEPVRAHLDADADTVMAALSCAHRFSLITHAPDAPQQPVRMHALLQRVIRDAVPPSALVRIAHTLADALIAAWPSVERDNDLSSGLRANTAALRAATGDALWQSDGYLVLVRAGRSLGEAGQARAARDYFRDLVITVEQRLGAEHPATLCARHHAALWTGEAGDNAAARDQFAALLPDRIAIIGPDHTDTLQTRHNLALWTGQAGDAAGARDQFAALLPDRLRVSGPNGNGTLATRRELARWTGEAGDPAAARDQFAALLRDRIATVGPDHTDTLRARHNLARWTGEAGDAAAARDQLAALQPLQDKVFGPDHPFTLHARHNLARWTGEAGDPAAARDQLVPQLADRIRMSGPDHPLTLNVRHNLARWTGHAGDAKAARDQFAALVPDRIRVSGPDHPHTLHARHNLAHWTGMTGDRAGAREQLAAVISDRIRICGADHPDTVLARTQLAWWTDNS